MTKQKMKSKIYSVLKGLYFYETIFFGKNGNGKWDCFIPAKNGYHGYILPWKWYNKLYYEDGNITKEDIDEIVNNAEKYHF